MADDFRADLHCHSTCSDGTAPPEEIIRIAKGKGLRGLSITDHDCVDAYQVAVPLAEEAGIRLLPGVEFSANHRGKSVHILAYSFRVDSPLVNEFCERHRERRRQRSVAIVERLAENDVFIDLEEYGEQPGMIGRPHIAQAMVAKGYAKDIQDAFHKYLKEGRCAFVPSLSFSVEETLDVIHKVRGLAVIAHPMLIRSKRVLEEMLEMNFDGLEGFYARFRASDELPFQQRAEARDLFLTGGSDYHGNVKPRNTLGCSWTPQKTFDRLWEHYTEVSSGQLPSL